MNRLCMKGGILLTAVSLAVSPLKGLTQETAMEVELLSNGGSNSYRLPDDVSQVELAQQLRGGCRFGKSWGYDLSAKDLWVSSGCGGRFRVTRTAQATSHGGGSNAGFAIAAVAAVAGLALLANHNSNRPNDIRDSCGPVRRLEQGRVLGTTIDCYDSLLMEACTVQWQAVGHVVGAAMAHCDAPNLPGDGFFFDRLGCLVDTGRIEERGQCSSLRAGSVRARQSSSSFIGAVKQDMSGRGAD